MGVSSIIAKAAVNQFLRSRSFVFAYVLIAVFLVLILAFLGIRLWLGPLLAEAAPDRDRIAAAAGGIIYCTVLVVTGLFLNISSAQPIIRAKASGTFESLLAAPVDSRDLWFAMSISSILPGIIAGIGAGIITALMLEAAYLMPEGFSAMSPWILVNGFFLLPVLYLLLAFLVNAVGVPGNPVSGNVIAQVFFPVYTSLIINLGVRNILPVSGWELAAVQGALVLLLILIVAVSAKSVTKERIVLSCRR